MSMTQEEWQRSREKKAARIFARFIEDVERGLISEPTFEHTMLDSLITCNPRGLTLWPAEIALLALALERKVIGAPCYERIMAASAGEFADTVVLPEQPVLH
jgi:hypothetical protein